MVIPLRIKLTMLKNIIMRCHDRYMFHNLEFYGLDVQGFQIMNNHIKSNIFVIPIVI